MKKFNLLLLSAMIIGGAGSAFAASDGPTKVFRDPNKVTITENDNEVVVNVDGYGKDDSMKYEYRISGTQNGKLQTTKSETQKFVNNPFKKDDDSTNLKPRFELFFSDFYFGWGGNKVDGANRDIIKNTVNEVGILNVLGLGYKFNANRSRLSLGLGFGWSWYKLNNPYFWSRNNDTGVLGLEEKIGTFDKHRASLTIRSLQVPFMFSQQLPQHWNVALGAVMNWNLYASYTNGYREIKTDFNENTRGLNQRKITFDFITMVTWHGFGAYFRYAPQSLFKNEWGPEIKNRWTLGVVVRGW